MPWVVALQQRAYQLVKSLAASNLEAKLDVVPLALYRALCRYMYFQLLPGGHRLPERANQTKGLDGGKQVEFEFKVPLVATSEAFLAPGFGDDANHASTMRYFPERQVLAYLTPPLLLGWKGQKDAISGVVTVSFDVTTWSADGVFNYGDDGWGDATKLMVQANMYAHAAEIGQRQELPSAIAKKIAKWKKRKAR